MSENLPKVAAKAPAVLDLEPGTYWWCACGLTSTQPFCNGAHKGTGFAPVKVEITEAGRKAFCQCRHSGAGPFCDGSHRAL